MKLLQNGRLLELHSMLQCRDNSDRSGKKYMQSVSTGVPKFGRLLPFFFTGVGTAGALGDGSPVKTSAAIRGVRHANVIKVLECNQNSPRTQLLPRKV